jgi:hypothetical protein
MPELSLKTDDFSSVRLLTQGKRIRIRRVVNSQTLCNECSRQNKKLTILYLVCSSQYDEMGRACSTNEEVEE